MAGQQREKVPIKPGHSLMDWYRVKTTTRYATVSVNKRSVLLVQRLWARCGLNDRRDIAGTGGVARPISKSELKQHNKPDDCWMALVCVHSVPAWPLPFLCRDTLAPLPVSLISQ